MACEDENQAAAMCYTSGTTGNPKGVVYIAPLDRSCTPMGALVVDAVGGLREATPMLPVVPMFHANAWGLCPGRR